MPETPPPASAGPRVSDEELARLVREARIFNEVFKPADVTMHDASKQPVAVWFQPEQNDAAADGEYGYYGYHEWGDFVEDSALPMIEPVALDLADSRTALAAANARIAVLEARDVLVQALSVPLGKLVNTHGRVQTLWDASLESGELDEGDFDTAMNDLNLAVDEMYEGCYETVHARRPERLATASPEPGAAHE